jgi:hypothetical protein
VASRAPDLLIYLCIGSAAFVLGWSARGWHDGTTVSVVDAAGSAQQQVDAGAAAQQRLDAGQRSVQSATESVRIVEREVVVDGSCPPGRGAVSPDLADGMRSVLEARSDASGGAGGVSGEGD